MFWKPIWGGAMLLDVQNLDVRYGTTHAVQGLSFAVEPGNVICILGANGAGKSSVLRSIAGLVPKMTGKISFDGADITTLSTSQRVKSGLILIPEGRQIFIAMTVEENLLFGAYLRRKDAALRREIEQLYAQFPNLAARRNMPAAVLSGGEQQMLAIARGLLGKPRLMMLDEPSLGLSPKLVEQLFDLLTVLHRDGLAMLLVEQNTELALSLAQHAYVLELGKLKLSGSPDAIRAAPDLRDAYFGATA
jgi:branched-chain amino acid transport system ATP-binding protein